MPIPSIRFAPAGGALQAGIQFKSKQVGVYSLFLWEAESNRILMERRGNNDNPEDDVHALPLPALDNKGRIAQWDITLIDPEPESSPTETYLVEVSIQQDGETLGTQVVEGTMTSPTVYRSVMVKLLSR
jgi:hypothetical protein